MKRSIRLVLGITLSIFILFAATKLTIAWLEDRTSEITNRFAPGVVASEVVEKFDGQIKQEVSIKNTGNIEAYMRVALIPAWKNADGTISETAVGPEYTAPLPPEGWFVGSDGFYYHQAIVSPGEHTMTLLQEFTMPTKDGLLFELQILASAMQADPKDAVEESWKAVDIGAENNLKPGGGS